MHDMKVSLNALVISLLCIPLMMGVFVATDSPRFQYVFGFTTEVAVPAFQDNDVADLSRTYFTSMAVYRVSIELFLVSFRYHILGMKVIKRKPIPLITEIAVIAIVVHLPGVWGNFTMIGLAFFCGVFAATVSFVLVYKRRAALHSPVVFFLTVPFSSSCAVMFPLAAACAYTWSVKYFQSMVFIQAFIVTCVFPGFTTLLKMLALSKKGSRLLFGRKFHLAEDFENNKQSTTNYTNTVRLVHSLCLLQIVGVFATLQTDFIAFLLSSLTKIITQNMSKYVIHHMETHAMKILAKLDGVYDEYYLKAGDDGMSDFAHHNSLYEKRNDEVACAAEYSTRNDVTENIFPNMENLIADMSDSSSSESDEGDLKKMSETNVDSDSKTAKSASNNDFKTNEDGDQNGHNPGYNDSSLRAKDDNLFGSSVDTSFDVNFSGLSKEEKNKVMELSNLAHEQGQKGWKAMGKPTAIGGVQRYVRDEEISDLSTIFSKTSGVINNTSSSDVFHYLRNFYVNSTITADESRSILHSSSETEEYTYSVLQLPAPARHREFVTKRLSLKIDEGEYLILFYSVEDEEVPEQEGSENGIEDGALNIENVDEKSSHQGSNGNCEDSNDSVSDVGSMDFSVADLDKNLWRGGVGMDQESGIIATTAKSRKSVMNRMKPFSPITTIGESVRLASSVLSASSLLSASSTFNKKTWKDIDMGYIRGEMILGGFHIFTTNLDNEGDGAFSENDGVSETDSDMSSQKNHSVRVTKIMKFHVQGKLAKGVYNGMNSGDCLCKDILLMVAHFHKDFFWPVPKDPFSDVEFQTLNRLIKEINFCRDTMKIKNGNLQDGFSKISTKAKRANVFLRHTEDVSEIFVTMEVMGMDVEVAAALKKMNFLGSSTVVDIKNDHSYWCEEKIKLPKPHNSRKMECLRVCYETGEGEFVIAVNSVTAPSSANLEKFLYMKCQGGSLVERISNDKCRVLIKMKYWFRGVLGTKKKLVRGTICKRVLPTHLIQMEKYFMGRKESSRVRSILDARSNLATYTWKNGNDQYTNYEKRLAKDALLTLRFCEIEVQKGRLLDITPNKLEGVQFYRFLNHRKFSVMRFAHNSLENRGSVREFLWRIFSREKNRGAVAPLTDKGDMQDQRDEELAALSVADREKLRRQTELRSVNVMKAKAERDEATKRLEVGTDDKEVSMPVYDATFDPRSAGGISTKSAKDRKSSLFHGRRRSSALLGLDDPDAKKSGEEEHIIFSDFIMSQKRAGTIAQFALSNSKTIVFAVGKAKIQCSPSLAKAWLCDDEFKEGIRKDAQRKDGVQRQIVKRLNDHSHIDYRKIHQWPMVPRDFLLRHVSMEVPIATKKGGLSPGGRSPKSREERESLIKQSSRRRSSARSVRQRKSKVNTVEEELRMELERETLQNEEDTIFLRVFGDYVDEVHYPTNNKTIRAKLEGMWVVKNSDEYGYTDVSYLLTMDPRGLIPEWIVKLKLEGSLTGLVEMKKQLETTSLEAQKLTYVERINKLERRLAIKWNQESFVEKSTIVLGALVSMITLNELTWDMVLIGSAILLITETINDTIGLVVAYEKLRVDQEGGGLYIWNAMDSVLLSFMTPVIICLSSFYLS